MEEPTRKHGILASAKLFVRQTSVLVVKNLRLSGRNMTATAAQLLVGLAFLLLLLIVNAAVTASSNGNHDYVNTPVAEVQPTDTLHPGCTPYITSTCYAFGWGYASGTLFQNVTNAQLVVDQLVDILGLNASQVFAFAPNETLADVNEWVIDNPNVTKTIVLFENSDQWDLPSNTAFKYTVLTNSTRECVALGVLGCDNPWTIYHVPLITALDAAFMRIYGGASNASIHVDFTNFPHPDSPSSFDSMKSYGALFMYISLTFMYVITMTQMVGEKENHLPESMRLMGMTKSAYWTSWIIATLIINTVSVCLLMLFGYILQFDLFHKTDGGLLLITFWLSAVAFSAFGFFLGSLVHTTASARTLGVVAFVISFIASPLLVTAYFQDPDQAYNTARVVCSIFPFISYFEIVQVLIDASSGSTQSGLKWSDRLNNLLPPSVYNTVPTFWSIDSSLRWLVASFFIFTALAWYCDQVIPTENGRRQPFYFPLMPSYWGFTAMRTIGGNASKSPGPAADPDVDAEAKSVYEESQREAVNSSDRPAVLVKGLTKKFFSGIPHISETAFTAVDNVWYSIPKGQLFALLGHNGSGKSTTFNLLTGLTHLTEGDAEIFGNSIRGDFSKLHAVMGICPQHDVLWSQLTPKEHLRLFATLKNFPEDKLEAEVEKRIAQVKLQYAADNLVGGFSGGMKRRLSIAIALIGDPAIVFLDEPTTGMDPVTRAEVLEMIAEAKKDRVIVLTSHAMEEVDLLADKVAIMSHGTIQAVGTTLRLKKRFGKGYKMTMFVSSPSTVEKIKDFMRGNAPPGTELVNDASSEDGSVHYQLSNATSPSELVSFFKAFESSRGELGIADYSLALSSLEDVFLNLSKGEEEEGKRQMSEWARRKEAEAMAFTPTAVTKRTSYLDQFKALLIKNAIFQCRNFRGCCFIIMFPVIILFALFALDRAVFEPLKVKAVCGQGVSKSDCKTKGPDLDCVAKIYEFRPLEVMYEFDVGLIDYSLAGRGFNPNCDSRDCFYWLEKMDSRNVPFAVPTDAPALYLNYSGADSSRLFEWHGDLLYLLNDTTCEDAYNDRFDSGSCASSDNDCKTQADALTLAKQYRAAQSQTDSADTVGIGACTPSGGSGNLYIPLTDILAELDAIEANKSSCQLDRLLNKTMKHFTTTQDGWNVSEAVGTGVSVNASAGLGSAFTLQRILGPEIYDLNKQLWQLIDEQFAPDILAGGNATTYETIRAGYYLSLGENPLDYSFLPSIPQLCVLPYLPALQAALNHNADALVNLCAFGADLDKVRGTSIAVEPNQAAVDSDIYHSWYGEMLRTPLMANATLQDYKTRQFYSKFAAFSFTEFDDVNKKYSYLAYYNRTAVARNGLDGNWKQLLYVADSAILKANTASGASVIPKYQDMPLKFKCNRDEWLDGVASTLDCDLLPPFLQLSIIDFVAAQLFPYLFIIHSFLIVSMIVYEKENRLRVIMRMNGGLMNGVYWSVNYIFYFAQFIAMCVLIDIVGRLAGLRFVSLHDPGVYWLFVVSWGNLMVVFSFLMSVFFSNSNTSTAVVYLLILVFNTVGIEIISTIIQDPFSTEASYSSLMWLPPFTQIRVVLWMALAGAFNQKIAFDQLSTFAGGAIAHTIGIMWGEWVACLILLWYLDNTWVAGFGVRKGWLFFLEKRYWTSSAKGHREDLRMIQNPPYLEGKLHSEVLEDIKAEYERVVTRAGPEDLDPIAVRIVRLHKIFENGYMAVRSVSLGINKKECFGLLGHNGAGKTTLLNMMVGLFPPSSGTALVDGLSIEEDMEYIQARMGICPQHDVVWGPLSVRDHLLFYARLKGVRETEITRVVDRALYEVNLKRFEYRAAQALSGGMRRRLSVAMSLIGSPKVVYLDEPSTGLDPASKRALWNVIKRGKGDKSLVLTTHSMEEAEVLCDRIGIMALGELQCVGTAAQLKRRFGAGYTFYLSSSLHRDDAVASEKLLGRFVTSLFPTAKPLGRVFGGSAKFEVRREEVVLSDVFQRMNDESTVRDLGLLDWSLTETTMEEVFLKLAEMAEVEEHISKVAPAAKRNSMVARLLEPVDRLFGRNHSKETIATSPESQIEVKGQQA